MSATAVAKKEFRDAIRSRTILALAVLFTVFTVGGVAVLATIPALTGADGADESFPVMFGLLSPASLFVPIIGLLVGYRSIAGERERGSIYSLLALPHSRLGVVVGKFVGRTGVVAVSTLVGLAAGAVALYAFTGPFEPGPYLALATMTILLGATFVGLATGLSAATASTTRAAWGAFGIFALFQFIWELLGIVLLFAITGSLPDQPPFPDWYLLFTQLNPQRAYTNTAMAMNGSERPTMLMAGGDPPIFLETWFSAALLVMWTTVPLCLGYLRFRTTDL